MWLVSGYNELIHKTKQHIQSIQLTRPEAAKNLRGIGLFQWGIRILVDRVSGFFKRIDGQMDKGTLS